MAETKIIYHIDEEETPYLVKLSIAPDKVTLADFKNVLSNRSVNSYKFFFKSMDQDFGVVKEEISDDNAKLPCFNGRVVSWLILAESSYSDGVSMCTESHPELPPPLERTGGIGDSRPPSFHAHAVSSREGVDTETASESLLSHRRERETEKARRRREEFPHVNGHSKGESVARDSAMGCDSGSVMSSELESSSFMDSEEEDASRLSSSTEKSSSSQLMRRHQRKRRRQKVNKIDRSSSFSSITDSTMSLNIITVTLNMEKYHFLGISIVGQSNDRGDGGIYIGSIMKGGAVAADARIEPGDMLLQVNDVNFENMSNDDAVRVLREIVSKPGPISLTVAKCWDPSPRSYFTIPHTEPVRPIDPAAWISHTTALTGSFPQYEFDDLPLTVGKTDMATIVKVMQLPGSGLDIRDRMWLKITISNAAIGAEVVDWLYSRVEGFKDRRDARKYASSLLKHGYLRHTVNKITFSDQCYYTFGDLCQNMASLNLNEGSGGGVSGGGVAQQDILPPLPPPSSNPWPLGGQPAPYPPHSTAPSGLPPGYCIHSSSAGSHNSEGSRSSGSNPSVGKSQRLLPRERTRRLPGSGRGSESEAGTQEDGGRSNRSASQMSHSSHTLSHTHSVHSHSHSVHSHSHSVRSHTHSAHSRPRSSNSHSQSHRSHSHSRRSHTSYARGHSPFSRHASVAPSDHSHASSCGAPGLPPPYSLSRHTHTHTHTHARAHTHTHTHTRPPKGPVFSGPPGAPPTQELLCLPPELTASRQSFQRAMGNPCEVFVDIM
ncbi:segment polarity protein dishevelled homolog DVL-1b isoform X2 [Alosa sapidissima]|uniref:segment polarity protein dishevelled homolog DVL-1b isoform X2 n=1 Tax=Alosa sapidissima TaxID=34773 RepID=UPI001C092C46|nr:segment polarity protein dishevelled homolog DVL-1b isoform X2 [Alosa sapidissima]